MIRLIIPLVIGVHQMGDKGEHKLSAVATALALFLLSQFCFDFPHIRFKHTNPERKRFYIRIRVYCEKECLCNFRRKWKKSITKFRLFYAQRRREQAGVKSARTIYKRVQI